MLHDLAARVRDGEVSPVDLVEESLRRIDAAGHLNAVVRVHADAALEEAARHPRTGPLAGLPLLVQDLARCKGSRTTMGSVLLADAPPDDVDDIAVARLRAAGAIVVGRTNSPAYGHAPFTSNLLFGATLNPWNPDCSPGGSSGGSTAALAAGLAPLATTSDGGGSIRIPAALCGLVGLKPTMGAVGRNVVPRWYEYSTMGATAATVADVVLQAGITDGPAPGDYLSAPAGTAAFTPTRPARIVACRTFRADVDATVEAAYDESLAALADDGFEVERIDWADGGGIADWFVTASAELAQSLSSERDRWDELEPSLVGLLHFGASVSVDDYLAATRRRFEHGARIDDAIGGDAVLAVPTLNVQDWPPDGPTPVDAGAVTGDPTIAVNTPDLNATGHPAVSVPMGLGDRGVPMGLQVVAPRWRDGLALGVAASLERSRPWPLVAPGYERFGVD